MGFTHRLALLLQYFGLGEHLCLSLIRIAPVLPPKDIPVCDISNIILYVITFPTFVYFWSKNLNMAFSLLLQIFRRADKNGE